MVADTQTEDPLLCFETHVAATRRLSPSFVRVTFAGESLARFDDGGLLGPRDLRIKVIVPVGSPPDLVDTDGDGWYQRWLQRDPRERGEMRTYTVRAVRHHQGGGEVDVDFVLHGHEGTSGPAADWASRSHVGERMLLMGPNRACGETYGGIEWAPPGLEHGPVRVLLVGDETAVPAVGSILETLPRGYVGRAVLEVERPTDFLHLRTDADVEVTWLARSARPRGDLLVEVVREAVPPRGDEVAVDDIDPHLLWDTQQHLGLTPDGHAPYVWIAGEAGMVKQLRRYLVGQAGLPRASVSFMGYWRVGAAL